MEYLTGEVPRTHRDLVRPADVPDILGDIDDEFLEQLRSLLLEQNNLLNILRDDESCSVFSYGQGLCIVAPARDSVYSAPWRQGVL